MIGRDDVVQEVERALADGALIVALVGEPGMGKTTIWSEVVGGRQSWTWTARCLEVERELGLAVLGDLFANVPADLVEDLPPPQRSALRVALFQEDQSEPVAERLLGATTLSVLRSLGERGPVTLGIDDLQWCDRTSFDALNYALHRLGTSSPTVVVTRRSHDGSDFNGSRQVPVGPLLGPSIETLIRSTARQALDSYDLANLVERSAGNPLYARELARDLVALDAMRLPASLRELLSRRLAAVGTDTQTALVHVAVRGAPPISELRADNLDRDLDPAFRAELIVLDDGRVRYTHPLLAAAVLEAAPPGDLRAAHALAAAAATDPIVAVLHRVECEFPSEALSCALDAAVDMALGRGDRDGALRLAGLAVDRAPAGLRKRQARLIRLGRLELGSGRTDRLVTIGRELREIADSPSTAATAFDFLGEAVLPDHERAISLYERAVTVDGLPHDGDWRRLVRTLALCQHEVGRPLQAVATLEAALAECDDLSADWADLIAQHAFTARLSGMPADDRLSALVARARAGVPSEDPAPSVVHYAIGVCGELATLDDRHDEAAALIDEAERLCLHTGELNRAGYFRGLLFLRTGRLDDAVRALTATFRSDLPSALGPARIAIAHVWRGDLAAAAEMVEQAHAIDPDSAGRAWVERNFPLAFAAVLAEDYAQAWPPLAEAAARLATIGHREPSLPPVLPAAIEAGAGSGHIEEAQRLCRRLECDSRDLGSRFGHAAAQRGHGHLFAAGGEPVEAMQHFRQASETFRGIGVVLEGARCDLALASLLRRQGQRRAARETLLAARADFDTHGALGLARRCDAELARIGGRASSGSSQLTESERRVAELVATGMRNAEVAGALHLSAKTVETHLSRVFRKLAVSNRTELARRLGAVAEGSADAGIG